MNKHTKIALTVLAIFIVGMTLSVAFAEPVKVKCRYKSGYGGSYSGEKGKYIVDIWKGPKQSPIYNGWNTVAKNTKTFKVCNKLGYKKPVTKVRLYYPY